MSTISSKLVSCAQLAEDTKIEISLVSNINPKLILSCTERLINLRNEIEHLKEDSPETIYEWPNIEILVKCNRALNKAQRQLIKRSLTVINSTDPTGFHTKIAEVWSRLTSGKTHDPQFGQKLLDNAKTDPILLQALQEYLGGDQSRTAPQLYVKPHFHHVLDVAYYQKIHACLRSKEYTDFCQQLLQMLKKQTDQNNLTFEFGRRFILQYMDHPIVNQAMAAFILNDYINPLKNKMENNDWDMAEAIYLSIPRHFKDVLKQKIGDRAQDPNCGAAVIDSSFNTRNVNPLLLNSLEDYVAELDEEVQARFRFPSVYPIEDNPHLFYSIVTLKDPSSQDNPQLNYNLELAYEAMSNALRGITYSTNWLNRDDNRLNRDNYSLNNLKSLQKNMHHYRYVDFKQEIIRRMNSKSVILNQFSEAIALSKESELVAIGNCGELAKKSCIYIAEKEKTLTNSEVFFIEGGNHGINLVGRLRNSKKNDRKTWGPAVVCGPWERLIYPATLINEVLEDYKSTTTGMKAVLGKFDPSYQELDILVTDMLSSDDLANTTFPNSAVITQLLDSYHNAASLDDKQKIAKSILEELPEPNKRGELLQLLAMQLNYFLHSKLK